MYTHLLLREGELFLKGDNRSFFERKLRENIRILTSFESLEKLQGRIIIPYNVKHTLCKRVFGLSSYSPVLFTQKDLSLIKQAAKLLLVNKTGTFRIDTNRADKTFPLTSLQVNKEVGLFLEKTTPLRFSLKGASTILHIEINQKGTYLFTDIISCFGGIPTGTQGRVIVLLEDEASILSALLIMKRGVNILPFSLKEVNLTMLQKFSPKKLKLQIVSSFAEIEKIDFGKEIKILVSGQRFEMYKEYPLSSLVLRPLIGYSEKEIKEELKKYEEC